MLKAGVSVRVVADRLGHSTPAFTLTVYGHTLPGQDADAANRLEAALRAGRTTKAKLGRTMAERTRKFHVQPARAGQCLCGCGQDPSSPKRQFRIGHDARLKSYGRKIEAGEMSRSSVSDAAAEWLAGHGIKVRRSRSS